MISLSSRFRRLLGADLEAGLPCPRNIFRSWYLEEINRILTIFLHNFTGAKGCVKTTYGDCVHGVGRSATPVVYSHPANFPNGLGEVSSRSCHWRLEEAIMSGTGQGDDFELLMQEDDNGWMGTSPLLSLVTFPAE